MSAIPCGAMSSTDTGDQPGGSGPSSPCCETAVKVSAMASGAAPAGTMSVATSVAAVPPSTPDRVNDFPSGDRRLSSNSMTAPFRRSTGRSIDVIPGRLTVMTPCPAAARIRNRPRASDWADSVYGRPDASAPASAMAAPSSSSPLESSKTSPMTNALPTAMTSVCAAARASRPAKSVARASTCRIDPGVAIAGTTNAALYGACATVAMRTSST